MKRLVVGALAVAMPVVGLAGAPSVAEASGAVTASAARPASYTPPPLHWHACTDPDLSGNPYGIRCATLVVPMDYSKPAGRKIRLAVSRLRHTPSAGRYQGVMLTNPGGPGGSGLYLSELGTGDVVPGDGDRTYDWIGFDPRGVGSSRPALTCDATFYGYDRPPYNPRSWAVAARWLRMSAHYARSCKDSTAGRTGLLDHIKTTDNVRDMDSLRKALGRRKINFYGFSYGTELGQVYATMFPQRVRRFVLDSNVDPRRSVYQSNLDQDRAFQTTIDIYFGWLAKYHDVFHLGTTRDQVAKGFYAERAKLDKQAAGGIIGGDELTDVLLGAGYYVYDWVEIGHAYSALVNHGDYSGIKDFYGKPFEPGADNGNAVYLATSCTDEPWPHSLRKIYRDNVRMNRTAPFLTWDNAWFNGPCSFWPAKPGHRVHVDGRQVKSPVLLIDETLDPATPYAGSLEVRRRFPTASLIEGVGGTTHAGSLSGVACTDDAIGRYLADGTVPARRSGNRSDLRCPPVPKPVPDGADALRRSAGARTGMPTVLREKLVAAQRH